MGTALNFDQNPLPPECDELRREVRTFLAEEIGAAPIDPSRPATAIRTARNFPAASAPRLDRHGTWPKKYGGRERNFSRALRRHRGSAVANAPVRLHFVADGQSGPIR